MYLSLKQHDLFLTLLMGFEIPFRTYVAETVLTKYDTYGAFENELISRRDNLSPSDPLFLRNQLPNICSERKCSDLYDKFITSKNNKSRKVKYLPGLHQPLQAFTAPLPENPLTEGSGDSRRSPLGFPAPRASRLP